MRRAGLADRLSACLRKATSVQNKRAWPPPAVAARTRRGSFAAGSRARRPEATLLRCNGQRQMLQCLSIWSAREQVASAACLRTGMACNPDALPAPSADATTSAPPAPPPATSTRPDDHNLRLFSGACAPRGRPSNGRRRRMSWIGPFDHSKTGHCDPTQRDFEHAPAIKVAHWPTLLANASWQTHRGAMPAFSTQSTADRVAACKCVRTLNLVGCYLTFACRVSAHPRRATAVAARHATAARSS